MQIDSVSRRQLKITLSATEIYDYFGTYKDIRYDNENSRAALGAILKKGIEETGYALSSGKLSIKVLPTDTGGCSIYFTLCVGKKLKKARKDYIYEFKSCEDMLSACEQIKLHLKGTRLSIYRQADAYRIITSDMCRTLMRIGTEYAFSVIHGKHEAEKTKEHWQKLCNNTPVEKIIV